MPATSKYKLSDRQLTKEEIDSLCFTCSKCSDTFATFKLLSRHSTNKHGANIKHFCPYHRYEICSFADSSVSNMDTHMNTHTKNKPHACPAPGCSRTFADPSSRNRHFKTHKNARIKEEAVSPVPSPPPPPKNPRKRAAPPASENIKKEAMSPPRKKIKKEHMSPPPESSTLASSSKDVVGRKPPRRRRRRRLPINSPERLNEMEAVQRPIVFLPPSIAAPQPRPPSNQAQFHRFKIIHHAMSGGGSLQPPPLDHPDQPSSSSSAVHGVHSLNLLPSPPPTSQHRDRGSVYLVPGTNPDIWRHATEF